ncbi:MAG: S1 RNA-binding domain-containing protein [Myxococcales bacterium]|nr:S1 RNA-binding domain-containing protein [Myxococcales bacterium]
MTSFWQFLNRDKTVELKGLTEDLGDRFAELIGRGHSVADLIGHYGDDFGHLTSQRLTAMHRAHRRYQTTRKRARQLQKARKDAKLPELPSKAVAEVTSPHELDALFRTARMCPRKDCRDTASWARVLASGADLWRRCVLEAQKSGRAKTRITDAGHPEADRYDDLARTDDMLADIAPHRWLAMRRGQRAGVLELELELPREPLLAQVEVLRSELGPTAADRDVNSLLDELVYDDLSSWLLQILDQNAEMKAIDGAAMALAGLLKSTPVQTRRLAAVQLGSAKAPVGIIIADREGELLEQVVLKREGNWVQKVVDFVERGGAQHVALPTSAPDNQGLSELERALGETQGDRAINVIKVRSAALAEARQPLTDPPHRLRPSVASALVLARRALDPLKEWSNVDPVSIGVAEYQNDLDSERLRAALKQTVALCRYERRRGGKSSGGGGGGGGGAPVARGASAMSRLNPLVKTIADLRPGMTVNGVITNISHFGAFVNIGLAQEGLVHISELSDEYVNDPNEVVRIGQQVNASVLGMDPGRGRISLSLKVSRAMAGARPGGAAASSGAPKPGRGPGGGGKPKSKAEALASLERLFKK